LHFGHPLQVIANVYLELVRRSADFVEKGFRDAFRLSQKRKKQVFRLDLRVLIFLSEGLCNLNRILPLQCELVESHFGLYLT
jgi:hypothetical protein